MSEPQIEHTATITPAGEEQRARIERQAAEARKAMTIQELINHIEWLVVDVYGSDCPRIDETEFEDAFAELRNRVLDSGL